MGVFQNVHSNYISQLSRKYILVANSVVLVGSFKHNAFPIRNYIVFDISPV